MNLTKAVARSTNDENALVVTVEADAEKKFPVCIEDCGPNWLLIRKEDVAWLIDALRTSYYSVYGEWPR